MLSFSKSHFTGSRDRSFSVWTTTLRRPFFVINDAFDQGVLDMSWSVDGKILLACSMDGSIAAVILTGKEMGKPVPDSKLYEMMREKYGKNFGTIANLKSMSNGGSAGPVVIENPEMLRADATGNKTTNGHDSFSRSNSSNKHRLYPQGPTDKQIEARTSDGRRRITPIYIPMNSLENGTESASRFGITEFGSASTKDRSKISVEKRNDIVKPNVSPNKVNPVDQDSKETVKKPEPKKEEEPKVNIIAVKKKPSSATTTTTSTKKSEPPVNVIQVKKKPGPVAQSPPKSQPPEAKKRKRIAVLSSSSSSSSSESESDDAMETDQPRKDDRKTISEDPSKSSKLKDAKVKKPELMTNKGNVDFSPKRPRGRPPLNREYSNELRQSPPPPPPVASSKPKESSTPKESSLPNVTSFKLPSLKMDKCKSYNFSMREKVTVNVNNNAYAKLHEVKCTSSKNNWVALFNSPVVTVGASQDVLVVACKNGTLHMFFPGDRGQRICPPLQLPSPISKLALESGQLAVVTSCGHFYIWRLDPRPKIKMAKENVQSLFTGDVGEEMARVAKIILSPEVILITSAGRSFTFDESLGSWLCLTETSSSIQSCSSYASAAANLPAETANLPLASLGKTIF